MGYVYARGEKLWVGYWDSAKKLHQRPTGFVPGEEDQARAEVEKIETELKSGITPDGALIGPIGPVTVRRYAEDWTKGRIEQGLSSAADDHTRLRLHAFPLLGDINMGDVRARHIRDLVRALRATSKLAPRTIRHVYGALHTSFATPLSMSSFSPIRASSSAAICPSESTKIRHGARVLSSRAASSSS